MKVPLPPHFSEQETKESGIVKSMGKRDIAEGKSIYGMLDRGKKLKLAQQLS